MVTIGASTEYGTGFAMHHSLNNLRKDKESYLHKLTVNSYHNAACV